MLRNKYYSDPKHVNLAKMQEDADTESKEGDDVIIHHHKHGEPCLGQTHQEIPAVSP